MTQTHIKTQIRKAACDLLKLKVPEVSNRVFSSRVTPLKALPALIVFTDRESAQKQSVGWPPRLDRQIDLVVVGRVQRIDSVDDDLDALQLSAEKAFSETINANTLGGLVNSITFEAANQNFIGDAEQPVAQVEMHFRVEFKTEANSPDNPA